MKRPLLFLKNRKNAQKYYQVFGCGTDLRFAGQRPAGAVLVARWEIIHPNLYRPEGQAGRTPLETNIMNNCKGFQTVVETLFRQNNWRFLGEENRSLLHAYFSGK